MGERMPGPYHYVRFRWWKGVSIEEIKEKLGQAFQLRPIIMPRGDMEISFAKDDRDEFSVAADTLIARLSGFRAVLVQKEAAPFTARDMELRKKVLELYPQSRPTPFPWEFSEEPKFQVAS